MIDFASLENSLCGNHPSQREADNPVLRGLKQRQINATAGARTLAQYSFLPKRIVGILTLLRDRLASWSAVHEKLVENIEEERGSATAGIAHYKILKRAFLDGVGLDIGQITMDAVTSAFIDGLIQKISSSSEENAVGIAYALEASAHSELRIVSYILNEYWEISGHTGELIRRNALEDHERAIEILRLKHPYEYTLEDFFVVHLQEFEVGHRDDLKDTIGQYVCSSEQAAEVTRGFEDALTMMDVWWQGMADSANAS